MCISLKFLVEFIPMFRAILKKNGIIIAIALNTHFNEHALRFRVVTHRIFCNVLFKKIFTSKS
jgi:hypothetical protein